METANISAKERWHVLRNIEHAKETRDQDFVEEHNETVRTLYNESCLNPEVFQVSVHGEMSLLPKASYSALTDKGRAERDMDWHRRIENSKWYRVSRDAIAYTAALAWLIVAVVKIVNML
jgi:hypothetical protein